MDVLNLQNRKYIYKYFRRIEGPGNQREIMWKCKLQKLELAMSKSKRNSRSKLSHSYSVKWKGKENYHGICRLSSDTQNVNHLIWSFNLRTIQGLDFFTIDGSLSDVSYLQPVLSSLSHTASPDLDMNKVSTFWLYSDSTPHLKNTSNYADLHFSRVKGTKSCPVWFGRQDNPLQSLIVSFQRELRCWILSGNDFIFGHSTRTKLSIIARCRTPPGRDANSRQHWILKNEEKINHMIHELTKN